jgi:hypothetical protein
MTRRRTLLLRTALIAVVGISLTAILFGTSRNNRVSEVYGSRLSRGMSREQVERIMEGPPDTTAAVIYLRVTDASEPGKYAGSWEKRGGEVSVVFDKRDQVLSVTCTDAGADGKQSLLARLRAWLGL